MDNFVVRKVAVLGAGVMGAQIAAHLTNAGVDTVLFDLPAKDGDPNGVVTESNATDPTTATLTFSSSSFSSFSSGP